MNTDGEIKYMLSNAPLTMPLEELVKVSKIRWTIEQLFQEGKVFSVSIKTKCALTRGGTGTWPWLM